LGFYYFVCSLLTVYVVVNVSLDKEGLGYSAEFVSLDAKTDCVASLTLTSTGARSRGFKD
jgi:hypothetical protein